MATVREGQERERHHFVRAGTGANFKVHKTSIIRLEWRKTRYCTGPRGILNSNVFAFVWVSPIVRVGPEIDTNSRKLL